MALSMSPVLPCLSIYHQIDYDVHVVWALRRLPGWGRRVSPMSALPCAFPVMDPTAADPLRAREYDCGLGHGHL